MTFVSKYVCYLEQDLPTNAVELLKAYERNRGDTCITKISDVRTINSGGQEFILGTLRHKVEEVIDDFKIVGEQIEDTSRRVLVGYSVRFIINRNSRLVIFTSTSSGDEFGKPIISNALFSRKGLVKNIVLDLARIEAAVFRAEFPGIWFHNYKKSGNIRKRQESGDNIQRDNDYKKCDVVEKSRLGVYVDLSGYTGKVLVLRKGGLMYYKDFPNLNRNLSLTLEIIRRFLPYSSVSFTL